MVCRFRSTPNNSRKFLMPPNASYQFGPQQCAQRHGCVSTLPRFYCTVFHRVPLLSLTASLTSVASGSSCQTRARLYHFDVPAKRSRDDKSLIKLIVATFALLALPIGIAQIMVSSKDDAKSSGSTPATSRPTTPPTTTVRVTTSSSSSNQSRSTNSRDETGFIREIRAVAPTMGSANRSDVIDLGDDVCSRYRRGESTVSIVNLFGELALQYGFPTQEATAFVAFAPIFLCPDVEVK